MKNNNPTNFLKHVISVITSIAKAKSLAIKSKADSMKTRLVVFSLSKNKKLSFEGISHKMHALLGDKKNHDDHEDDHDNKAIVLYNAKASEAYSSSSPQVHEMVEYNGDSYYCYHDDDDGKYPDLTHSMFDDDDENEFGDPNASAIDLVRNSKEEGENFSLEDEIDEVADLFIKKFHKRIRLQKLESFKKHKDMLERSA